MKRLSLLTAAILAVVFALPSYAADDAQPAQGVDSVELEMVRISAGSFIMGCQEGRDSNCDDREKPAHKVNLKAFEIGKYEVTQGQWKAIMGDNPSYENDCGDTCPVDTVSRSRIDTFIRKLNAQTGKTYRLPSEAEWEYACRAGTNTEYCGGNQLNVVAWHEKNSGDKTHPVGGKQANAWGLHDMSGNVWEWVQDDYHENYSGAPTDGTAWEGDGFSSVLRGGAWTGTPRFSRSVIHSDIGYPARGFNNLGFRLARTLP